GPGARRRRLGPAPGGRGRGAGPTTGSPLQVPPALGRAGRAPGGSLRLGLSERPLVPGGPGSGAQRRSRVPAVQDAVPRSRVGGGVAAARRVQRNASRGGGSVGAWSPRRHSPGGVQSEGRVACGRNDPRGPRDTDARRRVGGAGSTCEPDGFVL